MKRSIALVFAFLVAGCPSSTSSMTGTSARQPVANGPDASGNITIPNVFGMSKEQALAELQRVGFRGTPSDDSSLCGSVVDGRVIEIGQVCFQHPAPGRVQGARLPISLRVQTENPWHGNIGKPNEWRLMPNVINKNVEEARAELKRVGFSRDDRVLLQLVDDPSCKPLIVCRTYPEPMQPAGVSSDKIVFAGRDPNASSKPVEPIAPTAPKPDAPKSEPPPEPFF
jgi:hypothetical protein